MKKFLLLAILAVFTIGATTVPQPTYDYIGSKKCKMCHNKPTKGSQFDVWAKGPHAYAMETLKTDRAKEVGKTVNIFDPVTSPACISCHSTFGSVNGENAKGLGLDEGVSCESCHGPGSAYKAVPVMKDRDMAMDRGMILPTEEVCRGCHNSKSPTYRSFDYEEADKKIQHLDPTLH